MRVEILPNTSNVVRFPVERRARPTLELMGDIAPDVREVLAIAETFEIDVPLDDLRDRVDAGTAAHIAEQVPPHGPERRAMLDALLGPVVAAAITACHAARDLSLDAAAARSAVGRARAGEHFWMAPLEERAALLSLRAAKALVTAHIRVEEARGVARAVGTARAGEPWAPRDPEAEFETLLAMRHAG